MIGVSNSENNFFQTFLLHEITFEAFKHYITTLDFRFLKIQDLTYQQFNENLGLDFIQEI